MGLNDIIQLIIRPLPDHTSSTSNGKTENEENGEKVMNGETAVLHDMDTVSY